MNSTFMLERYRLGELSPEDRKAVDAALAGDESLRERLHGLEESDRELRECYPFSSLNLSGAEKPAKMRAFPRRRNPQAIVIGLGFAALLVAGIIVPALYVTAGRSGRNSSAIASVPQDMQTDRAKGRAAAEPELAIYLMGDQEVPLRDRSALYAGDTIQIAYAAPAGAEHYGVIFSIDGRSQLTMHYPYRAGQSSLLVSGKRTFLNEAYILDDAPDYEVFVMVISTNPLDAETVLRKAAGITQNNAGHTFIEETSRAVFEDCEVTTITVLKE